MQPEALVTIGVPNYNYAHFIIETLNSVISQTYKNIELIIVDDLSKDNSVAVIENWISEYNGTISIRFIKNTTNAGLTKVCNQILKNARGKYFQTLDADDLILPDKITLQVSALELSGNSAIVYSNVNIINEGGSVIVDDYLGRIGYDKYAMPQGNIFERLFNFNFIPLPSTLVNTEYARNAGGFNEALQVQDYYLWLKLSQNHHVIYLPQITASYREHPGSMSNSSFTNPKSTDSVLEIKYAYFKHTTKNIKASIRKSIYFSSAYLYRSGYPTAKKWLRRNLFLNPGIRSIVYFIASALGLACSSMDKIKVNFRSVLGFTKSK